MPIGINLSKLLLASLVTTLLASLAVASPEGGSRQGLERNRFLGAAMAGDHVIAVGEWGVVASSSDRGQHWRRELSPVTDTLTDVRFGDGNEGWAVGHNGVIIHSIDGGRTWTNQSPDAKAVDPLLGVHFFDRKHGFAVGAFGVLLETKDGGGSWARRDIGQLDMHLKAVSGAMDGALYIAGEAGTVYRSADFGTSFEKINTGYAGSFWGLMVAEDNSVLAYGMRGTVFRSENRGRSWQAVATDIKAGLSAGANLGGGRIVLVGAEGTVLESRDGGRSFQSRHLQNRSAIDAVVGVRPDSVLLLGRVTPTLQKFGSP